MLFYLQSWLIRPEGRLLELLDKCARKLNSIGNIGVIDELRYFLKSLD